MKKIEKTCTRSWCSVDILLPMRENLPWSSSYLLGIRRNKASYELKYYTFNTRKKNAGEGSSEMGKDQEKADMYVKGTRT